MLRERVFYVKMSNINLTKLVYDGCGVWSQLWW